MNNLTEEELSIIGFALACYLEDNAKQIKAHAKKGADVSNALEQNERIKCITYTKIIPNSWCGERPKSWEKYNV